MEDVWKEITTLSSFHPPLTPNPNPTHHHHGVILRDFFTAPPASENSPSSGESDAAAPAPASGFLYATSSSTSAPAGGFLLDSFLKKRGSGETDGPGDRRYKRMMKNRESAARSRARRTAYTFELEKERNQLIEENENLRKILQGKQLLSAVAVEEKGVPKKRNRSRSLSALF